LTRNGVTEKTGIIRPDEVPMAADEVSSISPTTNNVATCNKVICSQCTNGYPNCKGSIQSRLQDLPNIGKVHITRTAHQHPGEYSWSITFMTDLGNIPALQVIDNSVSRITIIVR